MPEAMFINYPGVGIKHISCSLARPHDIFDSLQRLYGGRVHCNVLLPGLLNNKRPHKGRMIVSVHAGKL